MAETVNIGTLIDCSPDFHNSRPKIAGTGVTVRRIAGWYKLGWTPEGCNHTQAWSCGGPLRRSSPAARTLRHAHQRLRRPHGACAAQQMHKQAVAATRHGGGQSEAAVHGQGDRGPDRSAPHAHPDLVGLHLARHHSHVTTRMSPLRRSCSRAARAPPRPSQARTVRSSSPNAATIAAGGHPWTSRVSTSVSTSGAWWRR